MLLVIPADSEERLADMLKDGNYLGGIVSKGETFTIRFPSVLRTAPLDLWKTSQLQVDSDKSDLVYVKEGFLQVMYATIFATEPMKIYIPSQPFNSDSDYQNKLQKMIRDPLKAARENILPLYFSTLYMYPFIRLVMHMEREKNLQLRDLMSISRASAFVQYISWFLSSFILLGFINWMTIFILKAPLCDNGNILNCSSFTALFLFFTVWAISGICFCFFTYVLFQTLILGCFFLAYFCLISYVLYLYVDVTSFPLRALLSLNFQFGFLTGIKQILRYEDVDCTGLQWEHYTKSDRTSFFFGIIPIMMIVGAFILLMLCCVFEECCPGRYGVSTFKRHSRFSKNDSIAYMRARTSNIINPAVVQTIMLRKSQHNKVPLRNFSMNMYDDQITVILGLSNSGKSAVINSISGSIPPDTGSVRIDNKDMFSNRSSTRKSLGLSPQHDALFDSLTVSQHMDFFATLRNIRRGAKWQAIERYLKALELWNYRNIKSRNLSPVHKRLLSVACAFCGNPRIILLDEPSERMEPCERRLLWNLLQMEKQCRTIIVTTYQIEEADFLGDRISILCDGQLIFNGTSTFLKNVYGSGYQLVCPQGEICQEPQITLLVMKYIPETRLSPEKIYEVSYNIPQENNLAIVPLLKELESTSNYLNMGAIGIGTTPTLEKFVNATLPQYNNCTVKCDYSCNLPKPDECLLRGGRLLMNQWKAMLSKKAYHMKYNWFLFFPLFFLLLFSFAAAHKYFFPKPVPLSYYKDNKQGRLISQKPLKLNENPYKSMCKIALVKDEEQKSTKASIYEEKYKSLKEIGCTVEKIKKDDFETKQKL
ncbi:ATP-binding cassette sub-family A member 17-like [Scaptodrosophila lebanonensis]|uniref:ATP-binding cassette sub-family A member 17-like n=1 Tax=Drosophila lebanonensis TaxID=7225 RepID=A0A6J2THZ5_DROLE|nr:ATP-binding cassette sub-family A member 17-like [Scaptodrosophila lebanonensis]